MNNLRGKYTKMVCGADLHRSYNCFYNKEVLDERDVRLNNSGTATISLHDMFIETYQKFVCFKDL